MNKNAVIAFLAIGAFSTAHADPSVYFGGGIGKSTVKDIEVADFGPGVQTDVEDTDTSFRIFAGYQFNKNFAAEIAYEDIGKVTVDYTDTYGDYINQTAEATALSVSALGMLPLQNGISLFGRLGLAKSDVDVSVDSSVGLNGSTSGSSTNPVFGVGAQYDFPGGALVRAEFNRYTDVGDADIGESDVDVFLLSAGARF